MNSKVGVVTPLYATSENKRIDYFKNCAKSILAQDADFIWTIVNNGSTCPETLDFLNELRDPRIVHLYKQKLPGDILTSSHAANEGFNYLIQKNLVGYCYVHSDDMLSKDSLSVRVQALEEGADMVWGGKTIIFSLDSSISRNSFEQRYLDTTLNSMSYKFPHHTSMWSKKFLELMLLERNGKLFDERIIAEDFDVTLLAKKIIEREGLILKYVDQSVYMSVPNTTNITALTSEEFVVFSNKIISQKHEIPFRPPVVKKEKTFLENCFAFAKQFVPHRIKFAYRLYESKKTNRIRFNYSTKNPLWFN